MNGKKFIGIGKEHLHTTDPGVIGYTYHTPAGAEHLPSDLVEHFQKQGKFVKKDRF